MGSQELAARWADALDGVVAPTLTRTEIETLLTGLCEELLGTLRGTVGVEAARLAASSLVAANYRDDAAVSRSVAVICRDMVAEICPDSGDPDYETVRDRAVTVAGEFAAGFTAALRGAALAEQETTLSAALAAVREEQARRQLSEARFGAIFAGASVGIGTIDAETGRVRDVNAAFAEMLGVPIDLILGRSVVAVLGEDNVGEAYTQFQQLLRGGLDRFRMETSLTRPDGHHSDIDLSMSVVRDARGRVRFLIGVAVDITERKALADRLWHEAHHDDLTGLANRLLFFDRLAQAEPPIGLCYLDLDGFKEINDDYGHTIGDRVLRTVAERLGAAAEPDGLAARIGGDEFIVLIERCAGEAQLVDMSSRLLAALGEPVVVAGGSITVGASIGTALVTRQPEAVDDLMHAVDTAMYRNKSARQRPGGRSRLHQ
ncbi:PAS domain S-box protein [Nocardia nova]|uniref:sensor domain-containing diguanylate cyclase n=1 Tax=Nocardia nova TaxID=37330 RepID=UPI000CEA5D06|nr:PAS domain S-box protein [Nocardia nova]